MTTSMSRTTNLVTAALVCALIAASAWVTLPLGAVPVTLQVFVVVLCALLLPPAWATASMALYLALGAVGLPIFSGANGGLGVIGGPTGGYLIGFVIAAGVASMLRTRLEPLVPSIAADIASAFLAVAVIYVVGTTQLAFVANLDAGQAILAGAAPFVVIDLAKAAAAVVVAAAVRRARR